MLDREDVLDSRFLAHDRHRIEIKLDLEFQKKTRVLYNVEYYFFIPQSLNISHESYSKQQFYSAVQHYVRFKTPDISIEKIFTPTNELSPFNKAIKALDEISSGAGSKFSEETAVDEMKLIGSIIRANIKDALTNIIKSRSERIQKEITKALLREIALSIEGLSSLKQKIISAPYCQKIVDTFFALDEYVGMTIEEYLTDLLKYAQENKYFLDTEVTKEIEDLLVDQRSYRRNMGYAVLSRDGKDNGHFLYQRSVLKKFISSALYLLPQMSDFNILGHAGPAIAAGFAMLFAILVTIYAQSRYAINSVAFVMIIVTSYIFKDRIKDWLKIVFSKKMNAWLYDRKTNVMEPAHNLKIGYIKETFSYVPHNMLAEDVARVRKSENKKAIEDEATTESVFRYKREICLNFEKIGKYHRRRKDLIDILRFSVLDFIKHADDEYVLYNHFDEKIKTVVEEKCSRFYYINVVVRYNSAGSKTYSYEKFRITVTKNGIYSVDEVI